MNLYYLMAQLPSLDGITDSIPLPITEERFYELCSRFLNERALGELNGLALMPPRSREKSKSALIEAWNDGERNLRFVLGKLRAEKLKKSFDADADTANPLLMQAVRTALDMNDPLQAEKFLCRYRLDFLESLRPMDAFAEDSLFYYALKLKLIARMRQFDEKSGEAAYKNIYNSIMSGERPEVGQ